MKPVARDFAYYHSLLLTVSFGTVLFLVHCIKTSTVLLFHNLFPLDKGLFLIAYAEFQSMQAMHLHFHFNLF